MWSSAPPSPVPLPQKVVVVGFYCCISRWVLLSLAPRQMIDSNGSYSPEQTALRNSWSAGCQFDRRKQHSCPLRLLGRATRLMHRRYSPRPRPRLAFLRRIKYLWDGSYGKWGEFCYHWTVYEEITAIHTDIVKRTLPDKFVQRRRQWQVLRCRRRAHHVSERWPLVPVLKNGIDRLPVQFVYVIPWPLYVRLWLPRC